MTFLEKIKSYKSFFYSAVIIMAVFLNFYPNCFGNKSTLAQDNTNSQVDIFVHQLDKEIEKLNKLDSEISNLNPESSNLSSDFKKITSSYKITVKESLDIYKSIPKGENLDFDKAIELAMGGSNKINIALDAMDKAIINRNEKSFTTATNQYNEGIEILNESISQCQVPISLDTVSAIKN
jgi:hypothetical protein